MKDKSLLAPISSQSISRNEKAKFDTSKFPPVPIIVDTNWLRYCVFPYRTRHTLWQSRIYCASTNKRLDSVRMTHIPFSTKFLLPCLFHQKEDA